MNPAVIATLLKRNDNLTDPGALAPRKEIFPSFDREFPRNPALRPQIFSLDQEKAPIKTETPVKKSGTKTDLYQNSDSKPRPPEKETDVHSSAENTKVIKEPKAKASKKEEQEPETITEAPIEQKKRAEETIDPETSEKAEIAAQNFSLPIPDPQNIAPDPLTTIANNPSLFVTEAVTAETAFSAEGKKPEKDTETVNFTTALFSDEPLKETSDNQETPPAAEVTLAVPTINPLVTETPAPLDAKNTIIAGIAGIADFSSAARDPVKIDTPRAFSFTDLVQNLPTTAIRETELTDTLPAVEAPIEAEQAAPNEEIAELIAQTAPLTELTEKEKTTFSPPPPAPDTEAKNSETAPPQFPSLTGDLHNFVQAEAEKIESFLNFVTLNTEAPQTETSEIKKDFEKFDSVNAAFSAVTGSAGEARAVKEIGRAASETLAKIPLSEGVTLELSRSADDGGLTVNLDPIGEGVLDLIIQTADNGSVTAVLRAEKIETLNAIRKEAPQLEKALLEAGINLGGGGLNFQQGERNDNRDAIRFVNARENYGSQEIGAGLSQTSIPAALRAETLYKRLDIAAAGGKLDIKI